MATEGEETATDEEQAPKKPPIILFAGVLLIAIGASIGGTMFFMGGDEPEAVAEEPEVVESTIAIYHNMRPAFHVNFMVGNKARVLQTEVTIMARDADVIEAVVNHAPAIRNKMIDLLSDQDYVALQTNDGKTDLRMQAKRAVDAVLKQETGQRGIESVLFTSFVLQ